MQCDAGSIPTACMQCGYLCGKLFPEEGVGYRVLYRQVEMIEGSTYRFPAPKYQLPDSRNPENMVKTSPMRLSFRIRGPDSPSCPDK
ncbi:hypothetical protein CDAR_610911 [Caerostris darwini]|uniref:Uncharacterized protein n=1 Tax=Caerostris darwini TaxID=1538125 RepID=A0AAV4RA31_9ARAC|nr:hypothetical protein CDAR_610911 [Caerostris darwini]